MTVLEQYARLEATAIWRADASDQRRNVFVSLGEATLVIHDGADVALAHWSLPAVTRLNPGQMPARYAPGDDAPEELEITDETMIEAIERVRKVVDRGRAHPGRLRNSLIAGALALVLVVAVFWMPGALVRQTAAIVPPASRAAIGDVLLTDLRPLTGPACRTPAGDLALARLKNRLLPDSDHRIAIVPAGIAHSAHLPGGLILIGRAAVEDFETPDVAAGYVMVEAAAFSAADPVETILTQAGLVATLRLLTSGALPPEVLRDHARGMIASAGPTVPEADLVVAWFATAGVPIAPYAYAVDVTGESVQAWLTAGAEPSSARGPILRDDDWVALQSICGN